MPVINETPTWGFQPFNLQTNTLASTFWEYRLNFLKSANDPLRYQVQLFNGAMTEATPATATGDTVNVVFEIIDLTDATNPITLATIKKSKDIPNKRYDTQAPANGKRFTIDISQIVADRLSYSLCPINKGTWQSNPPPNYTTTNQEFRRYGGMNGGLVMQDNVVGNTNQDGDPISNYNVSRNGTLIRISVNATFEVISSTGAIILADNSAITAEIVSYINSVNQVEKDKLYYQDLSLDNTNNTNIRHNTKFLTRCKNGTPEASNNVFKKPVRIDEQAEFLQFYIRRANSSGIAGAGLDKVGAMGLRIETFTASGAASTFYVRDFEDNLITEEDGTLPKFFISDQQNNTFIQNISPDYINNTAALKIPSNSGVTTFPYWTDYSGDKITDSVLYYRVSIIKFGFNATYNSRRCSEYRYFNIDRETKNIPYEFVRFHWLNSLGGTDSYTAKRDIVEGLSISRDVVERKSGDRTWYQEDTDRGTAIADTNYISDTMRGGDIYKGGREVTNVNAERNQSVYTEPLNIETAKWLEEIMLSPNVWIEMDTEATQVGKQRNPYLRPSDKEYIPVIITNSDIETVNQENGLVKFNIEYTLAHKVITQRN